VPPLDGSPETIKQFPVSDNSPAWPGPTLTRPARVVVRAAVIGRRMLRGRAYDAAVDEYKFVWKTARSWSGTCRELILRLDDGTAYRAVFAFAR
jgi:hypothetical protein